MLLVLLPPHPLLCSGCHKLGLCHWKKVVHVIHCDNGLFHYSTISSGHIWFYSQAATWKELFKPVKKS